MLPPVDEKVLEDNPRFAKLYDTLKKDILNPDGSTRHIQSAPEREAVKQALRGARLIDAKQYILEKAISSASFSDSTPGAQPSDQLGQLLLLLPSFIDSEHAADADVDAATASVLSSLPFTELESLLPELGAVVSAQLHASALDVARVAHPSTNPSFLHRHIPSLPADYAALCRRASEAQTTLIHRRLEVQTCLTKLLQSFTETLVLLVRSLEAKHGLASRNLELRALDVSLEAQQTELDVRTASNRVSREVYSPETLAALSNYSNHLKDAQIRAAERVRALQAELAEYGVGRDDQAGKEKTMRELARNYRDMEKQIDNVKRDLSRLDEQATYP